MYAQSPSTVFARRSRFAYGIDCISEWCQEMPERLKRTDSATNTVFCHNWFSVMVKYDESVEHDQVEPHVILQ